MTKIKEGTSKKKITYQENRITELKKLLVYYKEITETIREPFIILDKDLFVVTANLAFYRKFKVRKKDTAGKRIYDLGNNQWDSPELRELLENILPTHRVFNNFEVTHDFPILGRKIMLLNARQVDSKQLILLAMEDVTTLRMFESESKELTANLVKQRDQLQGLNDAKDEFISLASHQLRTPATAVKQYTGMLIDEYSGKMTDDQMSMLKVAYRNNERQLEIIEDLLRVAKVDAGKVYLEKSSCDIVKQLQTTVAEQLILFKSRNQSIILNASSEKIIAFIDPKLMMMVMENLLDNAGKYSPAGSKVIITVEQDENYTIVSIKDQGIGIHKSDYPKLFKKFSRIENSLSESVKGTGLGLYWVKKVIQLHGGSVHVTSVVNGGSTFTVKTPQKSHKPTAKISLA